MKLLKGLTKEQRFSMGLTHIRYHWANSQRHKHECTPGKQQHSVKLRVCLAYWQHGTEVRALA